MIEPEPIQPASLDVSAQLDRQLAMLVILIDMGASKGITTGMLEVGNSLTLEQIRYLSGPISVHKAGNWEKDIEEDSFSWLRMAVAKDRLEIVVHELKTGESNRMASASEILCCMYSATMVAPMHHSWADVYTYANSLTIPKHRFPNGYPDGSADWWSFMDFGHPLNYKQVKDDYELLARDIRRKVVDGAREKGVKLLATKKAEATTDQSQLLLEAIS